MNHIIFLIFLLLAEFLTGIRSVFLKVTNFFRAPIPSYTEALSGRTGLNENTYLLRGVSAPPAYTETSLGPTGLNASNVATINENTYLLRGVSPPPAYTETSLGPTGLNASNVATINENTYLLRGVSPPPAYTESISGHTGRLPSYNEAVSGGPWFKSHTKQSMIILFIGASIMTGTGLIISFILTDGFGSIK